MKTEVKNRARIEILSYIMQFAVKEYYGKDHNGRPIGDIPNAEWSFHGEMCKEHEIPIGSLCRITAASASKWYLSWLVEVEVNKGGFHRYLLESIEDGALCWWSNIGLDYFSPKSVRSSWRWTDKQFELNDRWMRTCFKKRNAYITKPMQLIFDGDKVTLKTRQAFGIGDFSAEKTFDNWRKVRVKDMLEFWDQAIIDRDEYEKTNKPSFKP